MGYFRPFRVLVLVAAATALFGAAPLRAQDEAGGASASDLAKLSQNPVGNVYNLPFQNNANFKDGDLTSNFLNIQPVIPVTIGKINLINRGIIPVGYQSEVVAGEGSSSGLGDITYEGLLSPAAPGKVIFGGGVALIAPTATETSLGKGKWQAGPAVIVLTMTGPWVLGALAQNTWSFAGDADRADVNFLFSQIFINYNIKNGWYLTTSPIITADWKLEDDKWTVPLGGGAGKVQPIGKIPFDFQIQAFYNVVKPDFAADWSFRIQIKPMFPK
jgi:hypothetical protein